jgi:hypothetical protein
LSASSSEIAADGNERSVDEKIDAMLESAISNAL